MVHLLRQLVLVSALVLLMSFPSSTRAQAFTYVDYYDSSSSTCPAGNALLNAIQNLGASCQTFVNLGCHQETGGYAIGHPGCYQQISTALTPGAYVTIRIILNGYSDPSCVTQVSWFAIISNTMKVIPIGTFSSTQSSSSSCSVTYSSAFGTATVTNSNGCVNLRPSAPSSNAFYARISSCPVSFNPPTTNPPQPTTNPPQPTSNTINWAGNYRVNGGCSTSSCCCLIGTFTVSQSGSSITIQGPVTGNCGTITSMSGSGTLSSTTSTTVTFNLLGSSYSATRSGNRVTVTNLGAPQCSDSATCISGACYVHSFALGVHPSIVVIILCTLVALFIAF